MILFLTILCVLSVSAGIIYLLIRRRRLQRERALSEMDMLSSADFEMTAIDQFLYDRCCRYMVEKKPFLVVDFALGDLAATLYTNKVYLSKTINRYSGKNFRQYVNYYRVMYAAETFRKNMRLRVRDLSEMSGFRTPNTFTQAFKSVLGENPSDWCHTMRQGLKKKKQE